jgi:tetratricopeptide (TPR) repeat protein
VLLVVLGLAGLGGYKGATYLWAERYYQQALRDLEHRDYSRARARLALCQRMKPQSGAVRLLEARAARLAGDSDDAERHLTACAELQGSADAIAAERAMLQVQNGQLAGGEGILLSEIEKLNPDTPLMLEALVQGYRKTGRLDHAVLCLDHWLARYPNAVQAFLWRGEINEQVNALVDALEDYRRAVQLDPTRDDARLRLAQLLMRTLAMDEAVGHFEYLYQQNPGDSFVAVGLARCRRAQGRLAEARELLEGVLASFPNDPLALSDRGKLALEEDQPKEAEKWLRRALANAPFDREANFLLAGCLRQLGKSEESKIYSARVRSIEADLEALSKLNKQISATPRDPAPRYQGGVILLRNKQDEEALRWFRGALQEDPFHVPTHEALADYYERTGQRDLAARHRQLAQMARDRQ